MDELDRYECFGIPHAVTAPAELAAIVLPPRYAARAPIADLDMLGIEAIPSPTLADFTLHG